VKKTNRYSVPEDESYEPCSNDEVLKNYLHITSKEQIEQIEANELQRAELELEEIVEKDQGFTATDICNFHELWLGDVYPFAGKYRTVSMSKAGFPFAAPNFIPRLMQEFEDNFLRKYTPCHESDMNTLAAMLGSIHAELIIIHPFREGNGRLARLLANLMAMQADMPQLNYSSINQVENMEGFENYIKAIHAAFSGDTQPIQKVFYRLLEDSIS
jgi:cell filamentation protein